ncbi:MAG: hypothetical protein J2P51_02310 [Hyphomicrobiaceae bacterium]|nr:hypothetical protein [Hyphomicrobiaceae bacterium]
MRRIPRRLPVRGCIKQLVLFPLALAALAAPAGASQINTGASAGAYEASFCPVLSQQLKLAQFDYRCTPSTGTRENMERVLANPRQLGYGQLDAFTLESRQMNAATALTVVRQDDVRECLFAVTRNKDITNWGELAAAAGGLRFILPPANSGSVGTFQFLRSIDRDGLGRAKTVTHAGSAEEAIRETLSADDTVSLFVEFADPEGEHFGLVGKLGGHIVPVIDRTILRQEMGGKKIYFAQETQVEEWQWTKSGKKVVTACTPLVVFTGAPDRVQGEQARKDHEDLIRTVSALKSGSLVPEESLFQRLVKRTKELSATSTEKMLEATEQAREKAKPYTDKAMDAAKEATEQAKQAAERASEAAKPYYDKGKEAAQKAYEDAVRITKELMDKSKTDTPKN